MNERATSHSISSNENPNILRSITVPQIRTEILEKYPDLYPDKQSKATL